MIKVYTPYKLWDVFYDWFGTTDQFERCNSIDEVCGQDIKIACVPLFFDNELSVPVEKFDLFLISDIEFNHVRPINEWLEQLQITNYLVAVGGLEQYTVSGNMIYRPWWTFNLVNQNTDQYQNNTLPEFDFDILLGAKKPHRNFVMARCQKSFLLQTSIVNYRQAFHAPEYNDKKIDSAVQKILANDRLLYPYVSPNCKPEWEVRENVDYQISDQVPWGIYYNTKYSTILETIYDKVFFFSEKPAKALYGKRVFVVFSCHNYLEQMKDLLGFKTFSGTIDESYDSVNDNVERFNMAFEQMEWLAKQDYHSIKEKTKDIVEYNYQRLFDLRQETADQMLKMVYNKIEEIKC